MTSVVAVIGRVTLVCHWLLNSVTFPHNWIRYFYGWVESCQQGLILRVSYPMRKCEQSFASIRQIQRFSVKRDIIIVASADAG